MFSLKPSPWILFAATFTFATALGCDSRPVGQAAGGTDAGGGDGGGGAGGAAVTMTNDEGMAAVSVGGDTVSVTVRDVDDNAPIPEVEVSIDAETRVGLAFDPTGRYLPEWFEAPSGVGKQARTMGAFSLLVRLTKAALGDATPDPQVIRTTEISGSSVEDFPGVFGFRLPAFYSYAYAGAVHLGELDSLKRLLEEEIAGAIGDELLAEAVTILGESTVGAALLVVSVSLTVDEFLLADYWRDLGYDDDDWFDLYYRTGTPPWGVPVHVVIWPRASAPNGGGGDEDGDQDDDGNGSSGGVLCAGDGNESFDTAEALLFNRDGVATASDCVGISGDQTDVYFFTVTSEAYLTWLTSYDWDDLRARVTVHAPNRTREYPCLETSVTLHITDDPGGFGYGDYYLEISSCAGSATYTLTLTLE